VIVILTDVNVLIHSHRKEAADHRRFRSWLEGVIGQPEAFGVSEIVLSAFVRVVTHRKVYDPPTPLKSAFAFSAFCGNSPTP
jgi:predicted nucleic acid-binding protein